VEAAVSRLPELLLDHANCESKAASSALAMMFAYAEDRPLALALARLAREELRHFEQVVRAMSALASASRGSARGVTRSSCAARCVFPIPAQARLLLAAALIEHARPSVSSCFAPRMPGPLARLYRSWEPPRRDTSSCTPASRAASPGRVAGAARGARGARGGVW